MIGTKTGQVVKFTPAWLRTLDAPPTFHLRVGALTERDLFEAELDGEYDAGKVYAHAIRASVLSGVAALGGDDAPMLTDLVNTFYSDSASDMPADEQARMSELLDILQDHWPEYRRLAKQSARRLNLMPTLALQRWCVGWDNMTDTENAPVPFTSGPTGRPDDEAMRRLPPLFIMVAGTEAYSLQSGRGEEKNLPPPSLSAGTRESSPSASRKARAGQSAASSGKKTRQSSSRAKSSTSLTSG